jgi:aspartyl-tRNA(Asn)/glutamyl-tRNA(Gln) amidotransferase subunit C
MAVSRDDVRHIAALARIGVPEERLDALVHELNGILLHMEALRKVASAGAAERAQEQREGMPLRADEPPSVALARAREEFAPAMKLGFFLVPRLATHEDQEEES